MVQHTMYPTHLLLCLSVIAATSGPLRGCRGASRGCRGASSASRAVHGSRYAAGADSARYAGSAAEHAASDVRHGTSSLGNGQKTVADIEAQLQALRPVRNAEHVSRHSTEVPQEIRSIGDTHRIIVIAPSDSRTYANIYGRDASPDQILARAAEIERYESLGARVLSTTFDNTAALEANLEAARAQQKVPVIVGHSDDGMLRLPSGDRRSVRDLMDSGHVVITCNGGDVVCGAIRHREVLAAYARASQARSDGDFRRIMEREIQQVRSLRNREIAVKVLIGTPPGVAIIVCSIDNESCSN